MPTSERDEAWRAGATRGRAWPRARRSRQGPSVWRRFRRHRLAMIGLAILVVLVFVSVFAPLIASNYSRPRST